jgi:hypothetical protein
VVTARDIVRVVCRVYDVPEERIAGGNRHVVAVKARQAAMTLQRELLGWSYPRIARVWSTHHTTVMAACRAVKRRCSAYPTEAQLLDDTRAELCEAPSCLGCARREQQLRELRALLAKATELSREQVAS